MYDNDFLKDYNAENRNDEFKKEDSLNELKFSDDIKDNDAVYSQPVSSKSEFDLDFSNDSKEDVSAEAVTNESSSNDGSYHHSYVNGNTYNPNKNTYGQTNYTGYSNPYSRQASSSQDGSYVNNSSYTSRETSGGSYQSQYQSGPQQTYYTNPYSNSYNTSAQQQKQKPKKESKGKVGIGTVAILMAVCIIVSGLCGFGGTMLYNTLNKDKTTADGSMVVHQVAAETQTATNDLVDKTTSEIAAEVADSVVEITTEVMTTNSFYGQMVQEGAGSGVIISDDGYIVTNNHVIDGASKIQVTLKNGEAYDATLVGSDAQEDTALIKIEETGLTEAVFGDSDTIKVGDKAVAIGNPLGTLGGTVTDGIISALDRKIEIDGETMTLLQTDTAINPGNSGGGLFNGQGELIGIVSAKSTGDEVDNLGFAIPINNVLNILSDLKEYGYVTGRPSLGVDLIDISNKMYAMYYFSSENTGVFINSVTSTTADQAGLKAGDRIVSVNGTDVTTSSQVEEIIEELSVGDEVSIVVERGGKTGTVKVKLEEMKHETKTIVPDSGSNDNYFNPFG